MSNWIRLDAQKFSNESTETKRQDGVKISVSLSPYDIPEAVRGMYDRALKRFVIEFKYLATEPWRRLAHEPTILLRVGENSGRLYGIEVDLASLDEVGVELQMRLPKMVNKAIDRESADQSWKALRARNYEIAKSVISTRRDELFEDLVATG